MKYKCPVYGKKLGKLRLKVTVKCEVHLLVHDGKELNTQLQGCCFIILGCLCYDGFPLHLLSRALLLYNVHSFPFPTFQSESLKPPLKVLCKENNPLFNIPSHEMHLVSTKLETYSKKEPYSKSIHACNILPIHMSKGT